ncbi:hypothetical protein [Paenibacillus kobensis]|uniref:hypothetical protein n=1 Tax=Paenibacillus kobensis TaxID=59841 RepID=UPI000FD72B71|nr:hypothetical protein [Paenibacillus kobensis]
MSRLYATSCRHDRDYARFVSYFIAQSHQFDDQYTFHEAVAHLMISLHNSRVMLFDDENGRLQAFILYRYEEGDNTVFIDSAIVTPEYRSSLEFYRGFGVWARHVMNERSDLSRVRLHVQADHTYLNKLYAKFAKPVGERENNGRAERIYETSFDELLRYLRVDA